MASRRGYVTTTEVDELIGSGSSTDLQISEAEELVDAYVGFHEKYIREFIEGMASSGGASQITLEDIHQNNYDTDYMKGCEIEILGGTGAGQRKIITGQTKAGVLTVSSAWATAPDSTSFYRIYQLGKFPRIKDVSSYSRTGTTTVYKQIPENIKRATAAQVEYMVAMGDNFFKTNKSQLLSERIGDYSYTSGDGTSKTVEQMIAPKAKDLLRGFRSRKGAIIA